MTGRVTATLPGGQRIIGRRRSPKPVMPGSVDTSAKAAAYVARNFLKTVDHLEFLGIPYAEPPVGALRWMPATLMAVPPEDPWHALTWGNVPWQSSGPVEGTLGRPQTGLNRGTYSWAGYGVKEDEDCLNLHIWTPDLAPAAPLPVLVYFHGGGHTRNTATLYRTWGDMITMKGCVVINVEYSLGIFGLFTSTALASIPQAIANLQLSQAIAALRWVQLNAAAFGGNKDRVCIFGSSAGGAIVQALMTTPLLDGETLFHAAWSLSGGGIGPRRTLDDAKAEGDVFLRDLFLDRDGYLDPSRTIRTIKAEDGDVAALRNAHPAQVVAHGFESPTYAFPWFGQWSEGSKGDDFGELVIDGVTCAHKSAVHELRAGSYRAGVPFVAGWVQNEAKLIGNAENLTTMAPVWARVGVTKAADVARVCRIYNASPAEIKRRGWGEVIFGYPAYRLCRDLTLAGETAWLLYFRYDTAGNGREAPGHANDLSYVLFHPQWLVSLNDAEDDLYFKANVYADDIEVSDFMMQRLANLAQNGNPNTFYDSPYDIDLFATPPALGTLLPFSESTLASNILDNDGEGGPGILTSEDNHLQDRWSFFDAQLGF